MVLRALGLLGLGFRIPGLGSCRLGPGQDSRVLFLVHGAFDGCVRTERFAVGDGGHSYARGLSGQKNSIWEKL